jgi:hypothetical protein
MVRIKAMFHRHSVEHKLTTIALLQMFHGMFHGARQGTLSSQARDSNKRLTLPALHARTLFA